MVLSLDADEELTPGLIAEIERQVPLTPEGCGRLFLEAESLLFGKVD